MPHISKDELGKDVLKRLFDQLFKTLNKAGRSNKVKYLASELFTHTERIMIAKRLMVILLLDKGVPQHVICSELHMSPSTVAKFSLNIESGKYRSILRAEGQFKGDIFDQIERILLLGMPPRVGRGRWNRWGR